jgi:L-ascorbate metabolism protein UlaG (beta-lactamase superfamily)/SAM-dependent methyltransferase
LSASSPRITYIGGPTALLEWGGLALLTDPTFDEAGASYRSGAYALTKTRGPAVAFDALPPIDAVLLSHDHHFDNLDESGRALVLRAPRTLTTTEGAARLGGGAVGLAAWQEIDLPAPSGRVLRVTATPCRHGPAHMDRGPVIGFVLRFLDDPRTTLYVSGDTVWYEGVREVGARYSVSAAIFFLGAARVPSVGPWHLTLTADEAVEAARAFPEAAIVPLHYEGWEHFSETASEIARAFAAAGLAHRLVWLEPGRAVEILGASRRDPKARFSGRTERYARFRPGYPEGVLRVLAEVAGLTASSRIADLGSGTGLSAEPFLRNGNVVFGVEPNDEMRAAAERLLSGYPRFHGVAGAAEATTLPDASVDLVVAGQAFHWFDVAATRRECARILVPGGHAALLWNSRRTHTTPFLRAYESLLERFGTDYREVKTRYADGASLEAFFRGGRYTRRTLANEQRFDLEGLEGRLLSSSYAPPEGHPDHAPMLEALGRIFEEHQAGGWVRFEYDTEIYLGRPGAG